MFATMSSRVRNNGALGRLTNGCIVVVRVRCMYHSECARGISRDTGEARVAGFGGVVLISSGNSDRKRGNPPSNTATASCPKYCRVPRVTVADVAELQSTPDRECPMACLMGLIWYSNLEHPPGARTGKYASAIVCHHKVVVIDTELRDLHRELLGRRHHVWVRRARVAHCIDVEELCVIDASSEILTVAVAR